MRKRKKYMLPMVLSVFLSLVTAVSVYEADEVRAEGIDPSEIPSYTDSPYTVLNDNVPDFSDTDLSGEAFEVYSELDALGRCGTAYANVGEDTMPTEERGSIGHIQPSGWHTAKYDCVDGKYLYNRCHLIGYQLTAENANEKNLITGTRYMNVEGMLPFENMVADYVKETGNHVLYRSTPVYSGDDLIASGVQIEAESVEDGGEGIQFHVYCYNVQPGVGIDYATGDSWILEERIEEPVGTAYILNTNTGKFHRPDCLSVERMKESNRMEYVGSREDLLSQGYEPCGNCNP